MIFKYHELGLLALVKSVIWGSSFVIFGEKYVRPFPQENKNHGNLKVTVWK